jgi:hypothetical protein
MADKMKPKPAATERPPPDDELRQMVREDIEEQRKLIEQLKRKMN